MKISQGYANWLVAIASSAFGIIGLHAIFAMDWQKSVGHGQAEMLLQMLQLAQVERFEVQSADNRWIVRAGKKMTSQCAMQD